MLSTAVYQPLSSLQVRHKQYSIIPHNQILTLLAIFLYMYVCLSLISG